MKDPNEMKALHEDVDRRAREFAECMEEWGDVEEDARVRLLKVASFVAGFWEPLKVAVNLIGAAHNIMRLRAPNGTKPEVVSVTPTNVDLLRHRIIARGNCPCPACVHERAKSREEKPAGPN